MIGCSCLGQCGRHEAAAPRTPYECGGVLNIQAAGCARFGVTGTVRCLQCRSTWHGGGHFHRTAREKAIAKYWEQLLNVS
jgi:hypothetical protein